MIKFIYTLLFCSLCVYNSDAQCSYTIQKTVIQPTCGSNGTIQVEMSPPPTNGAEYDVYLNGVFFVNIKAAQANLNSMAPGTYKIVVLDKASGCKDSTTVILVAATNSISVSSIMDSATCSYKNNGKITLLLSNASAPIVYKWSHSTTEVDSIAENIGVGTYSVTVTDASGCNANLSNIPVYALSNVLKLKDSIVTMGTCGKDTGKIFLSVSGGYPPIRFKWLHKDSFNMPLDSLPPGIYTCIFWDTIHCKDLIIKDIPIKLPPKPVAELYGTDTICPNAGFGFLKVRILSGDSATMTYRWSNDFTLNSNFQDGLTSGNYKVTVTDKVGCIDTPKKTIFDYPERTLVISGKSPITKNQTSLIILSDTLGLSNIIWEANSTSKRANNGLLAYPLVSTSYKVQATYGPGCITRGQFLVEVVSDVDNLVIPNCFTPNGDGKNDTYKLIGENNTIQNFEIRIYDRWGNNVYTAYDVKFQWDGSTESGQKVAPGVYTYMVKYATTNSNFERIVKDGSLLITK